MSWGTCVCVCFCAQEKQKYFALGDAFGVVLEKLTELQQSSLTTGAKLKKVKINFSNDTVLILSPFPLPPPSLPPSLPSLPPSPPLPPPLPTSSLRPGGTLCLLSWPCKK